MGTFKGCPRRVTGSRKATGNDVAALVAEQAAAMVGTNTIDLQIRSSMRFRDSIPTSAFQCEKTH